MMLTPLHICGGGSGIVKYFVSRVIVLILKVQLNQLVEMVV